MAFAARGQCVDLGRARDETRPEERREEKRRQMARLFAKELTDGQSGDDCKIRKQPGRSVDTGQRRVFAAHFGWPDDRGRGLRLVVILIVEGERASKLILILIWPTPSSFV